MIYSRIYDSLIVNAKARKSPSGYTEIHHILPRSLGGSNDHDNLVTLTAKEHYIAHHLLYKIYQHTEHAQVMSAAWYCMVKMDKTGNRHNSTQYTKAKEIWNTYNRGDTHATSDKTVYTFVHRNKTTFIGKRWEFCKEYDMNNATVGLILSGLVQLNWSLIDYISDDFYWPIYELTNGSNIVKGNHEFILQTCNIQKRDLKSMSEKKSRSSKGYIIISINDVPFEAKPEREYATGKSNPAHNDQLYTFTHPKHGTVTCTMKELCDRFDLVRTQISAIVYGRQKSTKGWRCGI